MGSAQSKIRHALEKKSKKNLRDNDSRTNPPQGPPPIHIPNEPNQAQVNTTYEDTHSRTDLPQGPPPVFIRDHSNPAPRTLQQQVDTTYQDTGDVLRESQIRPSGAIYTADAATYRLILPSQQTYAANPSSIEANREAPQLEHEVLDVSDGDILTSPEGGMGKIERYGAVSSPEVADIEKARNSRLWGEAIERLKQKEEIQGLIDAERGIKPVQRLLEEVESRRTMIETQRICYRNRKGEEVPVSDVIFRELNNYASIGDIALQHHPDVVALVWSGFRLLLQIGTSYVDNLAMILNSVGYLAWIICCGALYEELYLNTDTKCSEEIRGCLVTQYVSILTYLSYANEHLKGNKTERIFESLSPQLSKLLESIRDSENIIKERSDIAEKEAANTERSKQEESRRHLKYIREQLENVKSAVNECNTKLSKLCKVADETDFHNTLDWVCNIQYGKIHQEHKAKRTADTCLWLEQNSIFQDWVNCRSSSAVLWLRGAAGTGKTILASSIIDLLDGKYKRNRSLAYFYCSITSPDRILPESVLRAITKQLCHEYSGEKLKLPKKLVEIKEKRVRESAGLPSLEECTNLIIELSNYLSSGLWIVIDALDECDGSTRKNLFSSLDKIVTGGKDIRIFLTGRDETDIRGYMMQRHENYLIDPSDNASDIELYIKSELKRLYEDLTFRELEPELVTQVKNLEEENIESLKGNANGMFLSVHHRMEALRVETTLHGMQKAIKDFPTSLNTVYTDILDRISRQSDTDSTSAHEILKWLFYAVDDFSADTILEALRHSVSVKGSGNTKPKARKVRNAQNICCGLVIHDEKTGVLRFSHATVKEYLEMLNGPGSCISEGHEFMSDICLRILATSNYRMDEQSTDDTSSLAFINYATRNWGNHVRHCESRNSCQDFLKPSSSSYKAWSSKAIETIPALRMKEPPGGCVDLVWVACYYRLLSTLKANLERIGPGCVNAAGRTPLHHCAEYGYLEFVKYLVEYKDIDINAEDDMKRTPLLLAISSNQVDAVEALLEHSGLKIDMVDQDGRTALMHASLIGSDKIVQLLLDSTKCDVNVGDTEGYTALHHATLKGHESILDLLFRVSSLNINFQSQDGRTALSLAAQSDENIVVVEKLLNFQASTGPPINRNLANDAQETPLFIAARLDQQTITERLIQDERVDINCGLGEDNMFIKAAERNKAWLVKLLVTREDLDINRRGINGWTALSNAIRYNALEAFKYIIAVPRVDIECNDNGEDTLLHVAIEKDRSDMVSELLAHGANANATNQKGQTPLIAAAQQGYFDVFKVLFAHYHKAQPQARATQFLGLAQSDNVQIIQLIEEGYNINQRNESGKTELMIAAANGLTNNVETLLKKHAIDVNAVDDEGESALSLAILNGHSSVIDALVRYPDIEIKLPAYCGTTLPKWVFECTNDKILVVILKSYPTLEIVKEVDGKGFISLMSAAASNDIRAMQFLLAHGYSLNNTNGAGRTALIEAAAGGFKEAVTILLREEAININLVDSERRSALICAAENGHTQIVQALLEKKEIDINLVDSERRSALLCAAENGHTEVFHMLLRMDGIDVTLINYKGRSALFGTAKNGHTEMVQTLLKMDGIDINQVDSQGRYALLLAAENGHAETAHTLLKSMSGANINLVDSQGRSALLCAAEHGHTEVVRILLEKKEIDPEKISALLLAAENGHLKIAQTLLKSITGTDTNLVDSQGRSALLCAAEHGHTEVVEMLLEKEIDINLVDSEQRSALLCAAENGHAQITRMLLEKEETDIDLVDPKGKSALILAAEKGHTEVVQVLLEKEEIKVNLVDSEKRSALLCAAENGHTEIVQTLSKMDGIDINPVDSYGNSALIFAAEKGLTEVVEMLLEKKEVDVNLVNSEKRFALLCAAEKGHTEVVQVLLEKEEIKVNLVDSEKRSALLCAAENGLTEIVQTLLKMDRIDINLVDSYGNSALILAARNGHSQVVQALLERKETDINLVNPEKRSALLCAAENGHTEIVQTLLKMDRIDINLVDSKGTSALILAAEKELTEVVEMLLEKKEIDVNLVNSEKRSALLCAAENGLTEIVQTLLKMDRIDINLVDSYGNSALILAARNGHSQVVQALLERKETDINLVNPEKRSALLCAAENGHTEIVQTLLKMDRIDINLVDSKGTSALILAAEKELTEVVEMLLEKKEIDVNLVNSEKRSALLCAAENGHAQITRMLLEKEADIDLVDPKGKSALILAAEKEHTEVVQVLLEKEEIKVNLVDSEKNSALSLASKLGYTEIAKALLKHPQIDIRCGGTIGSTPLLIAAQYGRYEVFQRLFERYATDHLREMDDDGDTALGLSALSGNIQIMQLVLDSGEYNINHRATTRGYTALIWAVERQHKDAVETLLKVDGVDVGILDNEGESALDIAKSKGNTEIIALLEARIGQKVE